MVDAVWLENSRTLVDRVSRMVFDGHATLPSIPDDAHGDTRETWHLVRAAHATDTSAAMVDVVRDGQSVVLVIVRGDDAAVAAQADAVDAMVASVTIAAPLLDVGTST